MADISALQTALSSVVPDTGFMLDNRTVLSKLKFIERYAQSIPYRTETGSSTFDSWADFLFMEGNTPERLAELYQDPSLSDGELQPHQAFLLSVLTMLETPKALMNYFPGAHCSLYYRDLLGLNERAADLSQVAVSINLMKIVSELMVPKGTLLAAGQDEKGTKIEYRLDSDVFANQSRWSDLFWCRQDHDSPNKAWSSVVYDDEHAWNDEGVRLFDTEFASQPVLTGRMLISDELKCKPESGQPTFVVNLAEEVDCTQLSGQISSGEQWLNLSLSPSGTSSTLTFTLPDGEGAVSAPEDLAGAPFTKPVLRVTRQDGQALPVVDTLLVNGDEVESEQVNMTPFGHASQEQPVDKMQLYVGVRDLVPGQTLSLFWKLNSPQPLDVQWQYLNQENQWQSLDHLVVDLTQGLSSHGRWSAILPDDASDTAPAMPAGRYWVRATVEPLELSSSVAKYPWLNGILTNGTTASLDNVTELDQAVVMQPLPANSISQPAGYIDGISNISQPWKSWGGRPAETNQEFMERAAQRLSHRERAMTWPDMQALLKTEFPWVFDVLTPSADSLTTVSALMQQKLVVLPLVAEKDNDDVLRPLFNAEKLERMSRYLQNITSPWQNICVENPRYRDVSLAYNLAFKDGINPNYAEQQLRQFIAEHYMPWGTGEAKSISRANRLDYYDVLARIQQHPFVDYVLSLSLEGTESSVQGADDEVLIIQWAD
jgi:hypothetical protein